MIVRDGEKILTVDDAVLEGDAFEYSYRWDEDAVIFAIREEMENEGDVRLAFIRKNTIQ